MKYSEETLRKAQLIMLDILIEVDRICKKHNLKYWLDSGTLLGAVRHKGFIPWDDDLDISMTLEDYRKFCKIAQDELPQHMSLQTSEIEKAFPYDFAKIRSNCGIIIEKHEQKKQVQYNQGIFIDIFPSITIKKGMLYKYTYKANFLLIKLFSYKYLNIKHLRNLFISIADSLHIGWDNSDAKVIRSGKFPELIFYVDKKSVFPLKKTIFENHEFSVPNDVDAYLKSLYGKAYMDLPPVQKRITHSYDIKIFDIERNNK